MATLVLTIGSLFVFAFLSSTAEISSTGLRKQPPEAILYLNPFVAQADVACGAEDGGFGGTCGFLSGILGPTDQLIPPGIDPSKPVPGIIQGGGVAPGFRPGFDEQGSGVNVDGTTNVGVLRGGVGEADSGDAVNAADTFRDRFWPKTVISYLVLAAVLTILSIQFVSPTRRWRPSLPGPVRRLIRRRSAP